MANLTYKYLRIQGKNLVRNTMYARGIFSVCMQLLDSGKMVEEDAELFKEINNWFLDNLPLPPQCNNQDRVICWFKTENSDEMIKMIRPALWLLERYDVPYFLVYTNSPGEIVYEDKYQIVTKTDGYLQIEDAPSKEKLEVYDQSRK
ncbi:MAG: hypothetical protein IKF80_06895 [Erysipelotrichaceae bacterium]|nr:hypothetical protein [Erysipelotrichaceae bacterium]